MSECEGLGQEIYDQYVLNLLEGPISELVRTHLERECGLCRQRMAQSLRLMSGIAVSGVQASDLHPSKGLRRRVLRSIEPARPTWMEWLFMRETWAAAGMAAVLMGTTIWLGSRRDGAGHANPMTTAQVRPQSAPPVVNPPVEKIVKAERPVSVSGDDGARIAELRAKMSALERDVAASSASAAASVGQAETALRSERDRVQNLEAELAKQKTSLEAALQQRQQLETEYKRVQGLATGGSQPDRAAIQRVQLLEQENARLRNDLTSLRQRAEQNLQLASFLASPGVRLVKLKGTEAGGKATAQVLVSGAGQILLYANNLPALPSGREYQLWMIRTSAPAIVSAGVFRASDARTQFQIADASLLDSVTTLAVTDEPAGGSAKPTGHKVLVGSAKS